MALKNPFKLEKLQIVAYTEIKRTPASKVDLPFIAMFNPESFSQSYGIQYSKQKNIISGVYEPKYVRNEPSLLSFKLLLDDTGCHQVSTPNLLTVQSHTVAERIDHLLKISFNKNGDNHEPNYLIVSWGKLNFSCRLSSIDINYTSFNPDGTPLRAELTVKFLSDIEAKKRMAIDKMSSPDLTHSRTVKQGDTLPLLSKAIYGSSNYYLWLAQQNQLDNFRNLTPGQRLFFPPLPIS